MKKITITQYEKLISRGEITVDGQLTHGSKHHPTILNAQGDKYIVEEKGDGVILHFNWTDRNNFTDNKSISPLMDLINNQAISIEAFDNLIGMMKINGFEINNAYSSSYFDYATETQIPYHISYFSYLFIKGYVEKAKVLIKHGLDVNYFDPTDLHAATPLSFLLRSDAISLEDFDSLICLMMEHGLNINQTMSLNYTDDSTNTKRTYQGSFLTDLLEDGYLEKAKILIKHGSDVNYTDPTYLHSQCPLSALITNRDISLKELDSLISLMKEHGLNNINPTKLIKFSDSLPPIWQLRHESFLLELFKEGHVEKAKILIKHGMDVNFVDSTAQGSTSPFSVLNKSYNISVEDYDSLIELMKNHGLNMNQVYSDYINPSSSIRQAQLLIEHGININHFDPLVNKSAYQKIFSSHRELMETLHKAIIYGHNMVITPNDNDFKTKAAIEIYNYKFGDKKALDAELIKTSKMGNIFKECVSAAEYYHEASKFVDLGDGNQLPAVINSLIFAYLPVGDLVSRVSQGLMLPQLTEEQDVFGFFTLIQEEQNPHVEPHEVKIWVAGEGEE